MQTETSIQPTQPLVPHPEGERGIFAPKGKLEPRKPELKNEGYDDFLKGVCKQIDLECDERAEVRARRYTRNHNYWWGGERRWTYWTKDGYKSLDRKAVKQLFSNNQFFYQVRTILSTVTRSRPRLNISTAPAVSEDAEKVSAAKVATRSVQHDYREKLHAEFMIREWMDKLLCGFAVRGQWYAKEGSTAKARAPIIGMKQQETVPGAYVCAECGMTGPTDYGQGHQDQTGHEVEQFEGQSEQVPFISGYEEVEDGDCLTYGISAYEFDLAPEARDLPSSPYGRWQRRVRKSKLKRAYPKLNIDKIAGTELPIMLRAQEATKRRQVSESRKDFAVVKTYWLTPDYYFDFGSTTPFEAISGLQIPAGTILGELCPDGLRIDIAGAEIIDARPEVKEDCLSLSPFHLDHLSWEGKGVDDGAELQRWIDDIHTLYIQIQLREALGITLYDKDMVGGGIFTGEVGTVKGIEVPPDGSKKLQDALNVWSGQQPNASIFNGLTYVQQSQTSVMGGFPSLSGSNMEGSETARGRIILREQGLQGFGPTLILAARHDIVWAKQNLKLKKQYWTSERYVPYLDKDDPLGGKWFSASDLDADFIVDVEVDSWMPLTRMDEIDNMTTFMGGEGAIPGGFANTQIVPKAISSKAAELLNVPSGTDPEERDRKVAEHRYGILKQAIEMALSQGGQGMEVPPEMNSPTIIPPQMAMPFATLPSVIPVSDVDNHGVFIEFYKDRFKDGVESEGVEGHPMMKATLILLIKAHQQQGVFDTQEQGMMMMEAQAPQMMAQQAQRGAQADQQNQQQTDKSSLAHRQSLEKQVQGSALKQEEIKAKGKPSGGKSLLDQVKV